MAAAASGVWFQDCYRYITVKIQSHEEHSGDEASEGVSCPGSRERKPPSVASPPSPLNPTVQSCRKRMELTPWRARPRMPGFPVRLEGPRIKSGAFQSIFRLQWFDRSMPSMHVLIVEDEKKMTELLKKGLEEENHSVSLAFDGREGLESAAAAEFDVIVLDLMLPGVDGFEFARRFRKTNDHTPILVLTARDSISDIVKALDLGVDDYL